MNCRDVLSLSELNGTLNINWHSAPIVPILGLKTTFPKTGFEQCWPTRGILCNGVASVIMRCPKKTFLGQVWFSKPVIVLRPRWRVLNLSVHFRESYIVAGAKLSLS